MHWSRNGVLIVDDEAAIRELITLVIGHAGYRCFPASNGQEALEIFRRHHLEIRGVLTDVNMPVMNGFELLRGIRAIAPSTRVIFCSGSLGEAERRIAADLRVNAFLPKPWTAHQLSSCVRSVFESDVELVGVECGRHAA